MRAVRFRRIIRNQQIIRGSPTIPPSVSAAAPARADLEARVAARYEALMAAVASGHAPEFVALDVTMAQMKALYLVAARGSMHISALADLLGVTLSTGSGLVERLVDQGLLERRHQEHDRRHVAVSLTSAGVELMERMRELSARRVRSMLAAIDDQDLAALGRVLDSFIRQVSEEATAAAMNPDHPTVPPQQEGTR